MKWDQWDEMRSMRWDETRRDEMTSVELNWHETRRDEINDISWDEIDEMRWDEMRWDEMRSMRWDEIDEMRWDETRRDKMRWDGMGWDKMRWDEARRGEVRRDDMSWNEMKKCPEMLHICLMQMFISRTLFSSCLLRRRANARNVSYTPYPTGEKHTISTFDDQTCIHLARQRRKKGFFQN